RPVVARAVVLDGGWPELSAVAFLLRFIDDPGRDLGAAGLVGGGDELEREASALALAGEAEAEGIRSPAAGLGRVEPSEERAAGAVRSGQRERAPCAELVVQGLDGNGGGIGGGRG